MGVVILLILIAVPLVEIGVFISVGGAIGLWPTIAIVVGTAIAGTLLLRQQGLATLMRARQELAQQRMPVQELFDGACLLVAGALLLTPGFVTDGIGFALMLPPLRALIGRWLWRLVERSGKVNMDVDGGHASMGGKEPIIEGDYETVDPERDEPSVTDQRDRPGDGDKAR
ncbi:MAG: FxsA family protein [Alphaproteobacteria bacterium]